MNSVCYSDVQSIVMSLRLDELLGIVDHEGCCDEKPWSSAEAGTEGVGKLIHR